MTATWIFVGFRKRGWELFSTLTPPIENERVPTTDNATSGNQGVFVQVRDLRKTYKGDVVALQGASLEINAGEVVGLIGPNGAGKTTLIGCLLGLLQPDSGTVIIDGKSPDCLSIRAMTGYVPERPEFEYWMNARQFLLYHHGLANLDPRTAGRDVERALEQVELQRSSWNRRLKTYSRGMLQRLNLAQLVLIKPRLMLLDEPTLGLDPTGLHVVRNIVEGARQSGATVIINSHQLDEVERMCDRVAFMKKGRIGALEKINASDLSEYQLNVTWSTDGTKPEEARAAIELACARTGCALKSLEETCAGILVANKHAAADLLKELVLSGLPVLQAVPERTRLEQLFVSDDSADSGI